MKAALLRCEERGVPAINRDHCTQKVSACVVFRAAKVKAETSPLTYEVHIAHSMIFLRQYCSGMKLLAVDGHGRCLTGMAEGGRQAQGALIARGEAITTPPQLSPL